MNKIRTLKRFVFTLYLVLIATAFVSLNNDFQVKPIVSLFSLGSLIFILLIILITRLEIMAKLEKEGLEWERKKPG